MMFAACVFLAGDNGKGQFRALVVCHRKRWPQDECKRKDGLSCQLYNLEVQFL